MMWTALQTLNISSAINNSLGLAQTEFKSLAFNFM